MWPRSLPARSTATVQLLLHQEKKKKNVGENQGYCSVNDNLLEKLTYTVCECVQQLKSPKGLTRWNMDFHVLWKRCFQ